MNILKHYEDYKIIYADIVQGKTWCDEYSCYVKHFTDIDYAKLIRRKSRYTEYLIKEGLQTEAQKLVTLKEQGVWGDKEEDDILSLKYIISDNTKIVEKMPVPQQRAPIEAIIKSKREELAKLEYRRSQLIEPTVEYYSLRYYGTIFPQAAMFKDEALTIPLYSESQYDDMEDDDVAKINSAYIKTLEPFSDRNFRILACLPIVINQVSLCKKNVFAYYGKPLVDFTLYQHDVLSKTLRNLNIMEQSEGEPPEIDEGTSVQDLLDWYDLNYSVLLGKRNSGSQDSGVKTSKTYVKK